MLAATGVQNVAFSVWIGAEFSKLLQLGVFESLEIDSYRDVHEKLHERGLVGASIKPT